MSQNTNVLSVQATGTTVTSAGTTANVAIPTNAAGNVPMYCRLVSNTIVYAKIGNASVTATTNDIMVTSTPITVVTQGQAKIAYIQDAVTTGGKLNITPLENFR